MKAVTEPGTRTPVRRDWPLAIFRRLSQAAMLLALPMMLGGCGLITHKQSWMLPEGPVAQRQYDIFMVTVYVTVAIFVVVTGALLLAVFRFRDKGGADTELPPQTHGNALIEGTLGVVSALLLVLIAVPTVNGIFYTAEVPPELGGTAGSAPPAQSASGSPAPTASDSAAPASGSPAAADTAAPASGSPLAAGSAAPASGEPAPTGSGAPAATSTGPQPPAVGKVLHLVVTGHQWWWEFNYPDLNVTTADELHIPQNVPVDIKLDSADVIHSFWVPRLGGKTDVIPGQENHMWLEGSTLTTGEPFYGQCAEFCGTDHALMAFRVYVDTPQDFQNWVNAQKADAGPVPTDPDVAAGEKIVENVCSACHTVRGTPAGGVIGPDLTHVKSRRTIVAGLLPDDDDDLRKWLSDPQAVKPEAKMILPHKLSADEINHLIKYLDTLK